MVTQTLTKKNSSILKYHSALSKAYNRRGIAMPAKEAIAKTFTALESAVAVITLSISALGAPVEGQEEAYQAAVQAVHDAKQDVTVERLVKAEAPLKWSPKDLNELSFMFTDWSE